MSQIEQVAGDSYQAQKIRACGIQLGDWVRFYRGGQLVIEEVRYMKVNQSGYVYLLTDSGEIKADAVLEFKR